VNIFIYHVISEIIGYSLENWIFKSLLLLFIIYFTNLYVINDVFLSMMGLCLSGFALI